MYCFWRDLPLKVHKEVVKCRKNCTQTHLCIQCIINTGDYATTPDSRTVDDEMMHLNHSNLARRLNETDSDSLLINVVSYFSKGSTLLNKFNKMITSLVNTGLIIKAYSKRKERLVTHRTGDTNTQDECFIFTVPLAGCLSSTVELQLSGLIGTLSHPDT
jgi:hypothetical protein